MAVRPGSHIRNPQRDPRTAKVSTNVSSWLNFTPASLNPTLWLDASDISTITESSGSVSQWNDKSANGYTFTQGTGAAQPKTGARTQNGLNVLDFDGNDSLVSTAAASTWTFLHDGTKFIVATVTSRDAAGVIGTIMTTGNSVSSIGFQYRYVAGNTYSHFVQRGTGAVCVNNPPAGTGTVAVTLGLFSDVGNAVAADRSIFYVNRANGEQLNTDTLAPNTAAAPVTLHIGNRPTNAAPLDGTIAEIVVVSADGATLNHLGLLRNYLMNKWGTA